VCFGAESGVFYGGCDAEAADVRGVVGKDLNFGKGDDVGVVRLGCGQVDAAFEELRRFRNIF
jgi:hypothetical protein